MSRITVKVIGGAKFIQKLKEKEKKADKLFEQTAKKMGFLVEGDAKKNCPVDTGRLRGSISTNWEGSSMPRGKVQPPAQSQDGIGQPPKTLTKAFQVVVGTNVEYGKWVELGTEKMTAQSYLLPALRKNFTRIKKELKKAIVKGLK